VIAAAHTSRALEMTWEFSVQVSAAVQAAPPQITLSWPQDQYTTPSSYTIYRKSPSASSWGTGITLPGSATSHVDNTVTAGTAYEYQVVKVTSQYTGYGYVYSGINVPMTDSRGAVLLVVDNTVGASLAPELSQLQQDLIGDGSSITNASSSTTTTTGTDSTVTNTATDSVTVGNPVVWVDDALPAGAIPGSEGGDTWNWVSSSPAPYSGTRAVLSTMTSGLHSAFFWGAQPLNIDAGEVLSLMFTWTPQTRPAR